MRNQRKRIWIDSFQTFLSLRLAVYFLLYQFAIWALYAVDARMADIGGVGGAARSTYGFVLTPIALIFLTLAFMYDSVRFMHRIVGPLYRVRMTIQSITDGREVRPISFRQGDYLQELKDDVNAMLQALEKRGAITLAASTKPTVPITAA